MSKSFGHTGALILGFFATLILSASEVGAAGGSPGHAKPSFSEYLGTLGPFWFNFLLYVAVLAILLRKHVAHGWLARRERIKEHVAQAKAVLVASQEKLLMAERNLAQLPHEVDELKRAIKAESIEECNQIAVDARARAQEIRRHAELNAEAERRGHEKQLERELAARALEKAEQKIRSRMSAKLDGELRARAVRGVSQIVQ